MRARAALAAAVAAVLAAAALPAVGAATAATPAPRLSVPGYRATFAFVDRATVARSRPGRGGRVVGRLTLRTGDGTDELVGVLAQRRVAGQAWLRVQLPIRPTGATGWILRSAVGELRSVPTWLRISRRRLRATLVRNGRIVFTAPIGIGAPGRPTPSGTFYVRDRLVPRDPSGLYGPVAFGTSAHSDVLTDWPGGGYIGIHGTDEPQLIPGRVSHGCVRMRNADILRLDQLMPVGTAVTIS
ncbi:L,D-transpeptidase [Paraconexibacter antarcticus]|uniref:L,D-transpeptidase n=1 Tax=Paraconexibacter antarcticus TaxID=2949664 RepID=A0ABY5DY83_9ACTN|nr:L,D-transpeptidase [Paraconexibacter antarcticus]UTI66298.1 L,D-transpeptidase [Paraconexibacter antarcticus]